MKQESSAEEIEQLRQAFAQGHERASQTEAKATEAEAKILEAAAKIQDLEQIRLASSTRSKV